MFEYNEDTQPIPMPEQCIFELPENHWQALIWHFQASNPPGSEPGCCCAKCHRQAERIWMKVSRDYERPGARTVEDDRFDSWLTDLLQAPSSTEDRSE